MFVNILLLIKGYLIKLLELFVGEIFFTQKIMNNSH